MARLMEEIERQEVRKEVSLAEMLGFLRSNRKTLALLTLVLSVIAITVALLLPQQYNKRVIVAVNPVTTALLTQFQIQPLTHKQAGDLAVGYLQNANLKGVNASPTYKDVTQRLDVVLQSNSKDDLDGVGPKVVKVLKDNFQKTYEARLGGAIQSRITQLDSGIANTKQSIAQIDQQLKDTPTPNPAGGEDVRSVVRLQTLETKRADLIASLAANESAKAEMEKARQDLPARAREPISVELLSESDVRKSRSLVPVIILALLGSFIIAVILTLIQAAVRKAK